MNTPGSFFKVPWDSYWTDLLQGIGVTIEYTVAGFVGAIALGVMLALLRSKDKSLIARATRSFVEVWKNVPLITEIFIIYFGLSSIGINLSAFAAGSLALIGHYGAYLSEIFRAGMKSVDKGQQEAGQALGMTTFGIFRKILAPQAILVALPGTGTMLVDLLKSTSLMVTIGGADLMTQGQIVTSATFRALEVYIVIGAIYFALCFPLSSCLLYIERRLADGHPFSLRRLGLLRAARAAVGSRAGMDQVAAEERA
ncbi:amino acid ABC transporter permease [Paraburkholderia phosphatilytica]|uniref:amino acid ABC transporter permease n=1 Tax=Paraburkholderia phosphatilytica TaxID=2282883 RepID=UPI000E46E840|nr:amino acid ABC transporter permease [Paraburkholderia phosphatilytica]